jgi:CubicO group peptidase (beta-lactamase class C family)
MKPTSFAIAFALVSTTTGTFASESADRIAAVMQQFHSQGQFNGTVLVAREGDVIYSDTFGMADLENDVANEPDTRFRTASITKGVTATLALQAAERDELGLYKSILEYLPEVTNEALAEVTVEHLLNHTSGIEDFAPRPGQPDQSIREALVDRLNRAKLISTPGETHKYCNAGYTILGFVLENATGKSYEDLLNERVFEPLGMDASYLEGSPDKDYPARAQGYTQKNGQLAADDEPDVSLFPAAGGIVSTGPDLLRFSRGLAGTELLSQTSREKMLSDDTGKSQYGCVNRRIPTGDRVQIFQGDMTGTSSVLLRVNDGQYTIVLLANQSSVPCQTIAQSLLRALLQ